MSNREKVIGKSGKFPKGIARRREILSRAIEVFARRGSDKTSLRAIAKEVGVTHGALKHYFGSLEELLVAVYLESDKPSSEVAKLGPEATPVEIMLESARVNHTIPGLVQLYSKLMANALEDGNPVAKQFATDWFAGHRKKLADRVRENQRTGKIRADVEPNAVASLVMAASDGLQTQWLLDETAPQQEALELLARLLAPPD